RDHGETARAVHSYSGGRRRRMPMAGDATRHERWHTLHELDEWLRTPMLLLSLAWLALVLVELLKGSSALLATFGTIIWIVFIAEFLLRFALAPEKPAFLRRNWLTILSLV